MSPNQWNGILEIVNKEKRELILDDNLTKSKKSCLWKKLCAKKI